MRLFVAVPVPDHVRVHVDAVVARVRDDDRLSWTRPAGWHVTLAFLGEVPDDRLSVVADATRAGVARAVGSAGAVLETGGTEVLGRGALVLRVHDRPSGALADLGEAVQRACADADLPVTRREVVGHLTLGRARRPGTVPPALLARLEVEPVGWTLDRVEVVRSELGRGPARYASVAEVSVG